MFRVDYEGNEKGHFYNKAAIRAGSAKNSFESADLSGPGNPAAVYKTDSFYYGGHVGFGYVKNLQKSAELDFYTRLLWTRLNGGSVTLPTGDPIKFADSDSFRWRTGLRYGFSPNGQTRFYVGAAYEHEFDGEINATVYGIPIASPSFEGGAGIGEIGFTYEKPNSSFAADFNLSGFTGQREGFSARANLNWAF